MTKFDQIFKSYSNRFDCLGFTFCFMFLFQDNHNLVERVLFDEQLDGVEIDFHFESFP